MTIYEHLNKTNNYAGMQMLLSADIHKEDCIMILNALADQLISLGDIEGIELLRDKLIILKANLV